MATSCARLPREPEKVQRCLCEFDKAILKSGQEVMMNAGIQAFVAGRMVQPLAEYATPRPKSGSQG